MRWPRGTVGSSITSLRCSLSHLLNILYTSNTYREKHSSGSLRSSKRLSFMPMTKQCKEKNKERIKITSSVS